MSKSGNRYLGTIGDVGCFSMSPHKIITTGQGGFVVTNSMVLNAKVERLKDFGRVTSGETKHDYMGINCKFTDLQAVLGLNQLSGIQRRVYCKKSIYEIYRDNLSGKVEMLSTPDVPWFVDVYLDNRDEVAVGLKKLGIETRPMYGVIPHEGAFKQGGFYPTAEKYSKRGLFLPSSIDINVDEISLICDAIKEFI
jgi:perosamine synthetase